MNARIPKPIIGLSEIADRYDGFVLDLWGTIHDGATPYPGVLDCLAALQRAGKRCVLLSNAPRRAGAALGRLDDMGLKREFYVALETSGEAAWHALRRRGQADATEPYLRTLGPRCFYFGPGKDRSMLDHVPIEEASSIEACDFMLCSGLYPPAETPEAHDAMLHTASRLGRTMICINPDLIIHRVGRLEYCAGAVAQRYAELGGTVHQFGKPHAAVYARTLAHFPGIPPQRLLAVGDSLRTDIAGAKAAGIDSLLLTGGIHVEELEDGHGSVRPDRLALACRDFNASPTWVAGRMVW